MIIQKIISLINYYFRGTIPFLILANFVLLIIFIYLGRKELGRFFKKIKTRTWLIFTLILLLALFLRIFITPHQTIMFEDAGWYMETAKNMLEGDYGYFVRGVYKSIGWPFMIAIGFFFFGVDNLVAHYASSVLGILTVFNIFCLALVLFKKETIALWSAFLFSLIPVHIIWSGSAETNVSSVFFITLALFFSLLYFQQKSNRLLWLSLIALAFACQFRIENYFLLVLFLFGLLIFKVKIFPKTNLKPVLGRILLAGILIMLITPNLANTLDHHLAANWSEITTGGEQLAPNWGISNLIYNSTRQAPHFLDNRYHPLIFSVFLIIGLLFALIKKRKALIFLGLWFLLLYFIYFGSWPNLGPKSRFFMGFYPITSLFAGCGLYFITRSFGPELFKKTLSLIFIPLIILFFFPHIKEKIENIPFGPQGERQTAITHLAVKKMPKDCLIVANNPEVIRGVIDSKMINLKSFLVAEDDNQQLFQKTNCLLFFEDYTCDSGTQFVSGWQENCQEIKRKYELTPFLVYPQKKPLKTEQLVESNSFLVNSLASIKEIFRMKKLSPKQEFSQTVRNYGFYKISLKEYDQKNNKNF